MEGKDSVREGTRWGCQRGQGGRKEWLRNGEVGGPAFRPHESPRLAPLLSPVTTLKHFSSEHYLFLRGLGLLSLIILHAGQHR